MRCFDVNGTDSDSGKPVTMQVQVESVGEAAEFATKRGVQVSAIHAEGGHFYYPTDGGGFRRDDESVTAKGRDGEVALLVVAFLFPLAGLLVGSIRLARRDTSGMRVLLAGVVGVVVVTLILAVLHHK